MSYVYFAYLVKSVRVYSESVELISLEQILEARSCILFVQRELDRFILWSEYHKFDIGVSSRSFLVASLDLNLVLFMARLYFDWCQFNLGHVRARI